MTSSTSSPSSTLTLPTQISLPRALDVAPSGPDEFSLQLPIDIATGPVSNGGFVACVLAKCAVLHASRQPPLAGQTDVRSSHAQFFRPVLPAKGPATMKAHEVHVGQRWSALRVEMFQGESKIVASADVIISNLSLPGTSLATHWRLEPPPPPVDLAKLAIHSDPGWTCAHMPFHPRHSFFRPFSYAQSFIPTSRDSSLPYVEQWIAPGWDCSPLGSSLNEARWTTEMIQFVADLFPAPHQNFVPLRPGELHQAGSTAATLGRAAAQKRARDAGQPDWRRLDGEVLAAASNIPTVPVTLNVTTEIKKNLPAEGVRWLYLRGETKCVQNGRADVQVVVLDAQMELVATSQQVAQIIPSAKKEKREVRL